MTGRVTPLPLPLQPPLPEAGLPHCLRTGGSPPLGGLASLHPRQVQTLRGGRLVAFAPAVDPAEGGVITSPPRRLQAPLRGLASLPPWRLQTPFGGLATLSTLQTQAAPTAVSICSSLCHEYPHPPTGHAATGGGDPPPFVVNPAERPPGPAYPPSTTCCQLTPGRPNHGQNTAQGPHLV